MRSLGFDDTPKTQRTEIYERIREDITSSGRVSKEQLPPVKELAKKYGTSVFTIHQALQDLQNDGYVEVRHGAGTFVTSSYPPLEMQDTVTLCMHTRGDVFSDLVSLLMEGLADHEYVGTLLGTDSTDEASEKMIRRMAHSQSKSMIVQAGMHFPFEVFDYPGMRNKNIIAVLSWASSLEWEGLYRVVHDRDAGADMVVEYLRQKGHERVLVIGTTTEIQQLRTDRPDELCAAYPFSQKWMEGGGTWRSLESHPHPERKGMMLDEGRFLRMFDGADPPTAIFGLRDVEAWLAQDILLRRRPEVLKSVDIVGYGSTPWSKAGHPPFPTIDYRLEEIAAQAMTMLDDIKGGRKPNTDLLRIQPEMHYWN